MKIALINTSDTLGGAAIVTYRLMEALRNAGHDARMVTFVKYGDSPHVMESATRSQRGNRFVPERGWIFLHNGLNRENLFKVSIANTGMPLDKGGRHNIAELDKPGNIVDQRHRTHLRSWQTGSMDHARHVVHDRSVPSRIRMHRLSRQMRKLSVLPRRIVRTRPVSLHLAAQESPVRQNRHTLRGRKQMARRKMPA